MTMQEARQKLTALQHKLAAYGHALALMSYDGATTAPKGTAANRAQSMGVLGEELYLLSTGEESVQLLEFLDEHKAELDEKEQRIVYLLLRDIRRMQKIPMDEYIAYEKLTVEADDVWHTCKLNSDFATFEPYLQQIFDYNRKFARYCAPEKDPYDECLNRYEEGLDRKQCDAFFATLREHIVPLLHKVMARPQLDNSLIRGHFDAARQDVLSRRLMPPTGLDTDHVGALEEDSERLFRNATVYIGEIENRYLTGETRRRVIHGLYKLPMVKTDNRKVLLKDGEIINIDSIKIECILVPGHTWGHMVYLIDDTYLFTGDTIWFGADGGYSFLGTLAEDNKLSVNSLEKLETNIRSRNHRIVVITGHTGWTDDLDFAFAHRQEICKPFTKRYHDPKAPYDGYDESDDTREKARTQLLLKQNA